MMMNSKKHDELELYKPITIWFKNFLSSKFRKCEISVFDTHNEKLSSFLQKRHDNRLFELADTFDIHVDITALLIYKNKADLAFVEVKSRHISLRDVGQLLGYCLVANPKIALLISPKGPGSSLSRLVTTYGRTDILEPGLFTGS